MLAGACAAAVLAAGCSAPGEPVRPHEAGSRAFSLTSLQDLSDRADAVVIGRLTGQDPPVEGAALAGRGRRGTVTVERWVLGSGPSEILVRHDAPPPPGVWVADYGWVKLERDREYVLFLVAGTEGTEAVHSLVGGVGAYTRTAAGGYAWAADPVAAGDDLPVLLPSLADLTAHLDP